MRPPLFFDQADKTSITSIREFFAVLKSKWRVAVEITIYNARDSPTPRRPAMLEYTGAGDGAGMGAPQVGEQLIMHVHPCMFLFSSIKKH